jgi:DNA repair protein RadA/Sms
MLCMALENYPIFLHEEHKIIKNHDPFTHSTMSDCNLGYGRRACQINNDMTFAVYRTCHLCYDESVKAPRRRRRQRCVDEDICGADRETFRQRRWLLQRGNVRNMMRYRWMCLYVIALLFHTSDAISLASLASLTSESTLSRTPYGRKSISLVSTSVKSTKRLQQSSALTLYGSSSNYNNKLNKEEDSDDDEDDEPPEVNVANFRPSVTSYGLNAGRSSPLQRKAMGKSGSSSAHIHICSNCGSEFVQWMGRCPTCKEWNTLVQHTVPRSKASASSSSSKGSFMDLEEWADSSPSRASSWLDGIDSPEFRSTRDSHQPIRMSELVDDLQKNPQHQRIVVPDDSEFNTVLGGGIVPGSLLLIGGDPGVGKSTLLLQIAAQVAALHRGVGMGSVDGAARTGPVWYVSGEESPPQIASRAQRLGIGSHPHLYLLRETQVDALCAQVATQCLQSQADESDPDKARLSLLIIDSIQTLTCQAGGSSSAAGGITQVRECVALLLRLAKSTNIPIVLVGHVTKSGGVAGPRTVEHMVDAVLYLEHAGTSSSSNVMRLLRASKNRFGSTDEVGVYAMTEGLFCPLADPSSWLMAHRRDDEDRPGSSMALVLEGMRCLPVEVQALVTPAAGPMGRKTVNGMSMNRLLLLLGVVYKYAGQSYFRRDVYMNLAGATTTSSTSRSHNAESAATDLAVLVALSSSLTGIAVRADTALVGEVGLLGELRSVASLTKRLDEARRLGFSRVITPMERSTGYANKSKRSFSSSQPQKPQQQYRIRVQSYKGMEWIQCDTLLPALNAALVTPLPQRSKKRPSKSASSTAPGSLEELEEIMDDDDDDDEDAFL